MWTPSNRSPAVRTRSRTCASSRTSDRAYSASPAATPLALPPEFQALPAAEREEVLYRVTYAGYLAREERQVARLAEVEKIAIPANFDFAAVPGLRAESRAKLLASRPVSLGQASRISGVNPADITVLMITLAAASRRPRPTDGAGSAS